MNIWPRSWVQNCTKVTTRFPRAAAFGRGALIPIYLCFFVLVYLALFSTLVFNATDSLHGHGFLAFKFPKPLIRGSVVVAPPPSTYADKFEGLVFTKRLIGKPGDAITHESGAVCIRSECFELPESDGQTFGAPLEAGEIPPGFVALFGETISSLDSRYQKVGLFAISDIIAVGFALPGFPHWLELSKKGAVE